jgi:hypothetical protein
MIYFYSTKQEPSNAAYHRGLLFEELLRKYLRGAAYEVELTRRKTASAEYDLHGRHIVDDRSVIGEAKAHADTIGLQDVAAFVGKALPFLVDRNYSAVFLSLSPLSPEAQDYLRNLAEKTNYGVATRSGSVLEEHIREVLRLPTVAVARRETQRHIPTESGQHLLHSDRGTFIACVGSARGSFDDRFALVRETGAVVDDDQFLRQVGQGVQALQELQPVGRSLTTAAELEHIQERSIPSGLITAVDWFDYRRPAGADFFVGRATSLSRATGIIEAAAAGLILEVKSRSGVGKSSLLAVLDAVWKREGMRVELHDARDVQSSDDVLRLVQRLVGDGVALRNFESIGAALSKLAEHSPNGAVFMVDQFESTFQFPEVFAAYEYVALCIARSPSKCALVYSRKDDLLTTHDDMMVQLDRLRGLAKSIVLEDFSLEEANSLIQKIAQANPKKLSSPVLSQVLEFAQGFPWLLKRTMAHIAATMAKGTSQQELLSTGLHLEDLFEEELAELDEHERGYLARIAAVLPATYQVIARRFEDDPFLRQMLEKLTHRKLLRLSAGTYDTYNDVFKDFLLYERLPEQSHAQIIRMGLVPVMQAFRALKGANTIEPEQLAAEWGKPQTGIYNILRDLRLAGLVAKVSTGWMVPDVVRQYEYQNRLGEFVRLSVLRNRLVSDLIIAIEKSGGLPRREVIDWLRGRSRFVKAKDEVWVGYANTLIDWVVRLRLVELSADDRLIPSHADKTAMHQSLGNLTVSGRGVRPTKAAFVPNVALSTARSLLRRAHAEKLRSQNLGARQEMRGTTCVD